MILHLFNFTIKIEKRELDQEFLKKALEARRIEDQLITVKDKFIYENYTF